MATIVKKIRLNDQSEHETKKRALNHLFNQLSAGENLSMFDNLANTSSLKVKNFFVDNYDQIQKTMLLIKEMKEVETLKNF